MKDLEFEKSEVWRAKGKGFTVEVKHWNSYESDCGTNRWNVYVYLYPKFRNFDKFKETLGADIPVSMNWGNTFCDFKRDKDGNVTCKKYGSDYMHIHQDRFSGYSTPEEAYRVFSDAKLNYHELSEYDEVEELCHTYFIY